ncbi:MAG: HEPN domain-containing protein [Sulfolobales archaeon]
MVSRFRDWLKQSERNAMSALANYREGIFEEVCFESHQAAEKAIKALLNYLHKERRGHSLLFLLSEALVEVPEEIKQCVLYLDKHYIPSRYPDVYDEGTPSDYYTKEDAEGCLSCMSKIIDWVKSTVK